MEYKIEYLISFFLMIILLTAVPAAAVETNLTDNYLLKAADITFLKAEGLVVFEGDPSFRSDDFVIEADKIVVDTNAKTVEAQNNVIIYSEKDNIYGERLDYNYEEEKGKLYGAKGRVGSLHFSGKVLEILSVSPIKAEIEPAEFTSCIREDAHYHYKAKEVKINADNTMDLYHIVPYVWKIPVFYLPYYSVTYNPEEDTVESTYPMPKVGYDSDRGVTVELNYPYQINEKNSGKIDYLTEGTDYDRYEKRVFTNRHQLTDNIAFKNRYEYLYNYDLDDEELDDEEEEFFSSLEYNRGKYALEAGLGKDLMAEEKENRYFYSARYRFDNGLRTSFRHEYNFDWLRVKESYYLSYNQHPIKWQLKYIDGESYNYYPYLTLRFPSVLGINTSLGTGRVKNGRVTLNKERLNLNYNFAYPLFGGLSYHLNYNYRLDHYRSDYDFNYHYTTLNTGFRHRKRLNAKMSLHSSFFYLREHPWGERSPLPDDRENEEKLLKPALTLSIDRKLPQSSIALESDAEYDLQLEEWEEINLRLRQNEDCYSFYINYEFVDEAISFGLEI